MIASVSRNDIYRLCFPIFTLSCCAWSALIRWCPSLAAAIVTHFVTQAGMSSGKLSGGLSLGTQPLSPTSQLLPDQSADYQNGKEPD